MPFQDGVGIRGCVCLDWRLVRDLPEQACELFYEGFKFLHPVDVTRKTVPETCANNSQRIVIEALVISSNTPSWGGDNCFNLSSRSWSEFNLQIVADGPMEDLPHV